MNIEIRGWHGNGLVRTRIYPKWEVRRTRDGFWAVNVGITRFAAFIDWRDAIDYAARKAWS